MSAPNRVDYCGAEGAEPRQQRGERQLAAFAAGESRIRAFVCADPQAAWVNSRAGPAGPLAGALVGVKDIISTADFPTAYGSPYPENAGPRQDAWCVAALKRIGAVILGKTVSTEFAFARPGPTVNPHDPARTPGGSSSGSAAAVAAGFVSFALGTQTGGSTIRPAAYCGVVGYKPSFGLLHTEGVQAISTTLDHLGVFALSPRDAWLLTSAMLGLPEVLGPRQPRRVLCLRMPPSLPLDDAYRACLDRLPSELVRQGIEVELRDLPFPADDFAHLQETLCYWEAARILLIPGRLRLTEPLHAQLEPFLALDVAEYTAAARRRAAYRAQFEDLAGGFDAVLAPAATGIAPPTLEHTGDALMNRFWTALGIPCVTIPCWRSPEGLPLGLQLLGRMGGDRDLLATAQALHEA